MAASYYGVHMDMKGYTGGCVALGRGALMSNLGKQKLNTKSAAFSVSRPRIIIHTVIVNSSNYNSFVHTVVCLDRVSLSWIEKLCMR